MAIGVAYRPRNPETTVLYQVVAEQLETFLTRQRDRDRPVPRFVEEEFRAFLDCGILARGFLRLHCQDCGGIGCWRSPVKPASGVRRVVDDAWRIRRLIWSIVSFQSFRCGSGSYRCLLPCGTAWTTTEASPAMSWAFLYVFISALFGELRRRAERLLNLRSTQCGAVTFVQRFGDALNANVHFHSMVIDGVYAADASGRPEFHQLPAPEDQDVLRLTALVNERVRSLLEGRGLGTAAEPQQADPLSEDDPGMAALLASSVSRRIAVGSNAGHGVVRMGDQIDPDGIDAFGSPLCTMVSGFSVHANVAVEARDRMWLERLMRYAARPAVATGRLSELSDGRLHYRLKRPWRDGTTAVVFERQDFIAKLAVLVPAPRAHLTRYHGVFGPAAA